MNEDSNTSDSILIEIVQAVNAGDEGTFQSITIALSGIVITGRLIPDYQWFAEVGHVRSEALGEPDFMTNESSARRNQRDQISAAASSLRGLDDDTSQTVLNTIYSATEPAFIHLREARVVNGFSMFPEEGMHWRAQISEVHGWSLGQLSQRSS